MRPLKKDITTGELLARLFKATHLKDVLENEDIPQPPSFHEHLRQLCRSRGEIAEHVIKRAGIDRTYGHELFSGRRKPSRDKVIQLAFGFGLDVEETQQLLKVAQQTPLYPKIKRDAAVIYCLARNMEITEAQNVLVDFNLPVLGVEAGRIRHDR